MPTRPIQLRGVRVHNLKGVDLDIPSRKLVAFCGVSGSGKTSLALDTLYAEGQRRYIESFSAYTRQFLEQLEKPDADHIDGIPPAIAVTYKDHTRSNRATIGTSTEIDDHLRLLFAKLGRVFCHQCGATVQQHTPSSIAKKIDELPDGTRLMITFVNTVETADAFDAVVADLRADGFVRAIVGEDTVDLNSTTLAANQEAFPLTVHSVVDRLVSGEAKAERLIDSLETSLEKGAGACRILVASVDPSADRAIDGRQFVELAFCTSQRCEACNLDFPRLDPRLFSFNSPLGACPECEGFGNVVDIDMELVVPDPGKSLKEGAIAPWNTPAYQHELQELLALAGDYDIPTDVAFSKLNDEHLSLIREGVPERDFGGMNGFFAWLEKRKYKMHLR
ncbi:MAG: excinuclease ABC subunit A, partial [Pirellulaceae bacterium]|nr:excinuclease ABC subunit A [Pirellulaceae bacterium]